MTDLTEGQVPHSPSPEALKLYSDFLAETHKRELSGSENFDKSVLTLSSAGLGLSISFLKDFVRLDSALVTWILYASWITFTVATISTMASFRMSGKALNHHKGIAERAYMKGDWDAFEEPNPWDAKTEKLNRISAWSFGAALILTIVFMISNLEGKRMAVPRIKNLEQGTSDLLQKGAPVPTMQKPVPSPVPPVSSSDAPMSPSPSGQGTSSPGE